MEENLIKIILTLILSNLIIESKTYIAFSFDSQNLVIFNSRSTSALEINHIGTLKVTSMTDCALQCSSTMSCFSFFYNDQIGDCSLIGNIFLQTFENAIEEGWKYFKTGEQSASYAFIWITQSGSFFLFGIFIFAYLWLSVYDNAILWSNISILLNTYPVKICTLIFT